MSDGTAAARAQWSKVHGKPWSESEAGKRAAANPIKPRSTASNAGASGNSLGLPQSWKNAHAAIKQGKGGTVAGGFFGVLLFFTFRAYVAGGMPAVRAFYAAKFLNKTKSNPNPAPAGSGSSTAPQAPSIPLLTPLTPFGLLGSQPPTTNIGAPTAPTTPAPQVVAA